MDIIRRISLKTALILIGAVFAMGAYALPSRPEPQRLVNDLAGIFSSRQTAELEKNLVAFDDSTSNQITVVTVNDLEGYAASEYATRIGLDWGVGSEKFDNGIVVLVKPKTAGSYGEVFIAVGYGLEGAVPDAYAKRIIENVMIPHFRNNDYFSGVSDACDMLMKLASGEISEPRESEGDPSAVFVTLFAIFIIVCAIIAIIGKNDSGNGGSGGGSGGRRTIYMGPIITGGRNSGGSSFGGGFGGGFGGFGGGSFGGGGAGGRW